MSSKAKGGDIVIPELEEAMKDYPLKKSWTEKEMAILQKYYGRVSAIVLSKYLPGRTMNAIRFKAQSLLIPYQREVSE